MVCVCVCCVCVCVCLCVCVCVRPPGSTAYKWYKFDDSEVTEWKMDDDEVGISLTISATGVTSADTRLSMILVRLCLAVCAGAEEPVLWRGVHRRSVRSGPAEVRGCGYRRGRGSGHGRGGCIVRLLEQHCHRYVLPLPSPPHLASVQVPVPTPEEMVECLPAVLRKEGLQQH